MPELIDKEQAYTALKHEQYTHGLSFSAEAFEKAARIIDQMPTIEPEVRRGRWKKKNGEIYCTNCKKSKWSESFELMLRRFNFCPNCGARMDGGADNG